jgi:hypothetical protein
VTSGIDHFGQPDGPTSSLACLLVSSTYTFSPTHNTVADVTAWEKGVGQQGSYEGLGNDYSSNDGLGDTFHIGRALLQAVSSKEDDIVNMALMDASDIAWTGLNDNDSTIYGGLVTFVSANSDDEANQLLWFHDIPGAPFTPAGTMTLRFNATSGAAYLASSCG